MEKKKIVMVLGGSRSGKSEFAEGLVGPGNRVTYIATLATGDAEMSRRVETHRTRRPKDWHTVEEPDRLAQRISEIDADPGIIIVDCLTGWLSNLLLDDNSCDDKNSVLNQEEILMSKVEELGQVLIKVRSTVIIVSSEVGMGIVPAYSLGRLFRDINGKANRYLVGIADEAYLVVAGLPLNLKLLSAGLEINKCEL
ncbi:MAG: bifunctional adenosylcobinamide kinase/adenosylcobinamide-phosphate guanylyltransferase [Peptococcaceae bacterium]|nr:bifunctional adenosylcobinamide kinase/adenosylcobinamide-phosphate guanylyltransferase [Peptococcaceae bacterium]